MPELFIVEERVLQLMERVISLSIKGVDTQREFCRIAGMIDVNIHAVRAGRRGFTTRQILNLVNYFGVNLYWIFGLSENMFRHSDSNQDPIEYLKQAVSAVEEAMKSNTDRHSNAKTKVVKKVVK